MVVNTLKCVGKTKMVNAKDMKVFDDLDEEVRFNIKADSGLLFTRLLDNINKCYIQDTSFISARNAIQALEVNLEHIKDKPYYADEKRYKTESINQLNAIPDYEKKQDLLDKLDRDYWLKMWRALIRLMSRHSLLGQRKITWKLEYNGKDSSVEE